MRTTCPAAGTRVVVLDDAGKRTSPDVDRRSVYSSRATALIPNQANRAELTGSSTTSKYWAQLTDKRP